MRFRSGETASFGTLEGEVIHVHDGALFDAPKPTGASKQLGDLELLAPITPSKIVALWNNFHALAAKQNNAIPPEPLYFLKAPSSVLAPDAEIKRPPTFDGKVIFERELGVIGRRCAGDRRTDECLCEVSLTSRSSAAPRRA